MHYKYQKIMFEIVGGSLLNGFLLIIMIKRMLQLKDIGQPQYLSLSTSILTKITVLCLIILTNVSFILCSFLSHHVWMSEFQIQIKILFNLYYLFVICAVGYQIRVLHCEYKKKIPTEWYRHNLLWILNTTLYIILLLNTLTQQTLLYQDLIFDSLRLLFYCFLSVYGLVYKQDILEYECNLSQPLIYLIDRQDRRQQVRNDLKHFNQNMQQNSKSFSQYQSPNKLLVKFIVKDKVLHSMNLENDVDQIYEFNIVMLLDGNKYKVKKNFKLRWMNTLSNKLNSFRKIRRKCIEQIQNFLNSFIYYPELLNNDFMDFMQFPQEMRKLMIKRQGSQSFQCLHEDNKQTLLEDKEEDKQYQNYFRIQFLKSSTDEHQIQQVQDPFQMWVIYKRFNDFRQLVKAFNQQGIQDVISLPSKIFNQKRGNQLEKFLKLILNHKKYMTISFFNNYELNLKNYKQKVKNHLAINVQIQDIQLFMQRDKYVKYFKLKINEYGAGNNVINIRYVKRRFKEFYSFKQELSQIYGKQHLFQLFPSKFNKNSQYRKQQLQIFLDEILKLQDINDSYTYLSFFDIQLQNQNSTLDVNFNEQNSNDKVKKESVELSIGYSSKSQSQKEDELIIDMKYFSKINQF